jgi:hypothetical protein
LYCFIIMKPRRRIYRPTTLVLVRAGSVLDMGATAMPRHARVIHNYPDQTAAGAVIVDWDVIAREFNRVARGKSSAADQ